MRIMRMRIKSMRIKRIKRMRMNRMRMNRMRLNRMMRRYGISANIIKLFYISTLIQYSLIEFLTLRS